MATTRQYATPKGFVNETTNTYEYATPFGFVNETTSTAVAAKLPPPKIILQAVNRASTF